VPDDRKYPDKIRRAQCNPAGLTTSQSTRQIVTEAGRSGLLRRRRGVTMPERSAVDRISPEAEGVEP